MALTACTECGHQVSTRATSCPNCGCPVDSAPPAVEADSPQANPTDRLVAGLAYVHNGCLHVSDDTIEHLLQVIPLVGAKAKSVSIMTTTIRDRHIKALARLSEVTELSVGMCGGKLIDEMFVYLKDFPKLCRLDIQCSESAGAGVTPRGARLLGQMPQLEFVKLPFLWDKYQNPIKELIDYLRVKLPNCVIK